MYIVAIAWIYVTLLVSLLQPTIFRTVVTFAGVGMLPLALLLYLFGAPQRKRWRAQQDTAPPDELNADRSRPASPDVPSADPADTSRSGADR